ncbi:hypothetical protein FRX31_002563, partial [Thalictrum thalictroides]
VEHQRAQLLAICKGLPLVSEMTIYSFMTGFIVHFVNFQADLMRKKLPWSKYDKLKVEYVQAGKDEPDAKVKMDAAAKVLCDLKYSKNGCNY